MPRKQEFRKGTAAYRLAKAQGRLPAKSKSTKKIGNPLSKLMGALTGKSKTKTKTNKTFVPKKTKAQGTTKPKTTTKTTTPGKNVSGGARGQKNITKVTPSNTTNNKPKNNQISRVAGRVKGGPKVVATNGAKKKNNRFKRGPRK